MELAEGAQGAEDLAVELGLVTAQALDDVGMGQAGLDVGDLAPAGEGLLILALEGGDGALGELAQLAIAVGLAAAAGAGEEVAQGGWLLEGGAERAGLSVMAGPAGMPALPAVAQQWHRLGADGWAPRAGRAPGV